MNTIKRIYYLCAEQAKKNKVPRVMVLFDYLWARVFYGFITEDYFFHSPGVLMRNIERRNFFSYGKTWKIINKYDDKTYLHYIDNKVDFLNFFSDFIKRKWCYPNFSSFQEFLDFVSKVDKIIAKPIDSLGGQGIYLYKPSCDLKKDYEKFKANNYLLEEYIIQNRKMQFNNKSVNTLRVYTFIDKQNKAHIIKISARIGVGDSVTDNYHTGGVLYPVNNEYGFIEGAGVQIGNEDKIYIHPGTNQMMLGYKIPNWECLTKTVTSAANKIPQIRYLGWDVVVLEDGVDIIEANSNAGNASLERIGSKKLIYGEIKKYM